MYPPGSNSLFKRAEGRTADLNKAMDLTLTPRRRRDHRARAQPLLLDIPGHIPAFEEFIKKFINE
jgi:hypothetical protein